MEQQFQAMSTGQVLGIILGAIAIGVAAIIATFFAGVKRIISARLMMIEKRQIAGNSCDYRVGVSQIVQSYELMAAIHNFDFVDRVLLMSGANGGGTPKAGKPYNIVCNGCIPSDPRIFALWQGPLMVDLDYMKTILKLIDAGMVIVTAKDLPPDSMLANYYQREGVVQTAMYVLSITGEEMRFCSVSSYRAEFKPSELAEIRAFIYRMRSLMGASQNPGSDVVEKPHP